MLGAVPEETRMNGKTKAALLMGALILLSFLAPLGGGVGKKASPAEDQGIQAPPAAKGTTAGGDFSFLRKRGSGAVGAPRVLREGRDWKGSLFQVGGATVLVLLLAGGAVYLLSRLQRSRGVPGKRRALSLVEVLPLGRRKRLLLARAADRLFLLGETEKGLTLLADLTGGEPEEEPLPLEEEEEEEDAGIGEPLPRIPAGELPFKRILKAGTGGAAK